MRLASSVPLRLSFTMLFQRPSCRALGFRARLTRSNMIRKATVAKYFKQEQRMSACTQSVSLNRFVPKVAVAGALHDGLCERELYVRTKSLGRKEVRTADQQESELRLTQFLVELSVPASRNIDSACKAFTSGTRTSDWILAC